jgi:hypothetical protein
MTVGPDRVEHSTRHGDVCQHEIRVARVRISEKRRRQWDKFLRVTLGADRIGIWWIILGPGGVLVSLYGAITWAFEPIARHGWAAVVLSSILLALFTIFCISLSLIAWRYFRSNYNATTQNGTHDQIHLPTNLDVTFLFTFAIDLATIHLIEHLINQAPDFGGSNMVSAAELPTLYENCQKFIRRVTASFRDENREMDIRAILISAAAEAEQHLRETPPPERPNHIDPIDLQKYSTAELQCIKLLAYLVAVKNEKRESLASQRGQLAGRLALRYRP